jgi:hypothetical protein
MLMPLAEEMLSAAKKLMMGRLFRGREAHRKRDETSAKQPIPCAGQICRMSTRNQP